MADPPQDGRGHSWSEKSHSMPASYNPSRRRTLAAMKRWEKADHGNMGVPGPEEIRVETEGVREADSEHAVVGSGDAVEGRSGADGAGESIQGDQGSTVARTAEDGGEKEMVADAEFLEEVVDYSLEWAPISPSKVTSPELRMLLESRRHRKTASRVKSSVRFQDEGSSDGKRVRVERNWRKASPIETRPAGSIPCMMSGKSRPLRVRTASFSQLRKSVLGPTPQSRSKTADTHGELIVPAPPIAHRLIHSGLHNYKAWRHRLHKEEKRALTAVAVSKDPGTHRPAVRTAATAFQCSRHPGNERALSVIRWKTSQKDWSPPYPRAWGDDKDDTKITDQPTPEQLPFALPSLRRMPAPWESEPTILKEINKLPKPKMPFREFLDTIVKYDEEGRPMGRKYSRNNMGWSKKKSSFSASEDTLAQLQLADSEGEGWSANEEESQSDEFDETQPLRTFSTTSLTKPPLITPPSLQQVDILNNLDPFVESDAEDGDGDGDGFSPLNLRRSFHDTLNERDGGLRKMMMQLSVARRLTVDVSSPPASPSSLSVGSPNSTGSGSPGSARRMSTRKRRSVMMLTSPNASPQSQQRLMRRLSSVVSREGTPDTDSELDFSPFASLKPMDPLQRVRRTSSIRPRSNSNDSSGTEKEMEALLQKAREIENENDNPIMHLKDYEEEARRLVTSHQMRDYPREVLEKIYCGNMDDKVKLPRSQGTVRLFTSSTFTDTYEERNTLMREVYPKLKEVCVVLGWEFQVVDMRWGIRNNAMDDHRTEEMCLTEVTKCCQSSAGPAFVTFLGNKAGFRPIPAHIPQQELEMIVEHLKLTGSPREAALIQRWYKLDENELPPRYDLLRVSALIPDFLSPIREKQEAASAKWDGIFKNLQQGLRLGSSCLEGELSDKYFFSMTGEEVDLGVIHNNERASQAIAFERHFDFIPPTDEAARFWTDVKMEDGKLMSDTSGQNLIADLKKRVINVIPQQNMIKFELPWVPGGLNPSRVKQHNEYLTDFKIAFESKLCESILHAFENKQCHLGEQCEEVLQHRDFAFTKSKLFVGRLSDRHQIQQYLENDNNEPLVVHGHSGIGKTALMARAAMDGWESRASKPGHSVICVMRFIGTTPFSSTPRDLLHSICWQITMGLKLPESDIPFERQELQEYFIQILRKAKEHRPIYIFLDSLDQLIGQDRVRSLEWVPALLPPHVKMVLSTLPDANHCLATLKSVLGLKSTDRIGIGLEKLKAEDGGPILEALTKASKRRLTEEQSGYVLRTFETNPFPLQLNLAFDVAKRWKSYEPGFELPLTMRELVVAVFDRLEGNHGTLLVSRALGYITSSKFGISQGELEDVLSLDDEVLEDVYQWWVPPIRRLPPLLWARVREDLGGYLVESGVDGVALYKWFHRQFWEAAEDKYLGNEDDRRNTHKAIAEYFNEDWVLGKPITVPKGAMCSIDENDKKDGTGPKKDRCITKQPLTLQGTLRHVEGRQVNTRRLHELPHHQIRAGMTTEILATLTSLDFIEANLVVDNLYGLVYSYVDAMDMPGLDSRSRERLTEFWRFVVADSHGLMLYPFLTFQKAFNQPDQSPLSTVARDVVVSYPWVQHMNKDQKMNKYPRLSVMAGHTDSVTAVAFSSDGKLMASAGADKQIRVWDSRSGQSRCIMVGHTDKVLWCEFDENDTVVVSCSKDFTVRRWSVLTGEELKNIDTLKQWSMVGFRDSGQSMWSKVASFLRRDQWQHSMRQLQDCTIMAVASGRPNRLLVFARRGLNVSVYDVYASKEVFRDKVTDVTHAVRFNNNGTKVVALLMNGTMTVWDTTTGKVVLSHIISDVKWAEASCGWDLSGNFLLLSYREVLMTFDMTTEREVVTCRGHREAITACISNGRIMASGSKDMSVRLWDAKTGYLMAVLHDHHGSITSLMFSPDSRILATASTDKTVRLWDLNYSKYQSSGDEKKSHRLAVNAVRYSKDGKFICTCSKDKTAKVWTDLGEEVFTVDSHTDEVNDCCFDETGKYLITCSKDGVVGCFDTTKGVDPETGDEQGYGQRIAWMEAHCGSVVCVKVGTLNVNDQSTPFAVSGGVDGLVLVWNYVTGDCLGVLQWHVAPVTCIDICPNSHRRVASSSSDGHVIIWDIIRQVQLARTKSLGSAVNECKFTEDGRKVMSASTDCKLRVWDASNGSLISSFSGHIGQISTIASLDNDQYVSGSEDMSVRIWRDMMGVDSERKSLHRGPVNHVVVSKRGKLIISAGTDSTIRIWDLINDENHIFSWKRKIRKVDFFEKGRVVKLAAADELGEILVLELKNYLLPKET